MLYYCISSYFYFEVCILFFFFFFFKQKTAYEIMPSLVGSEMCIRDSSGAIQKIADSEGGEVTPEEIWQAFEGEYLKPVRPLELASLRHLEGEPGHDRIEAVLRVDGVERAVVGAGHGPCLLYTSDAA